MTVIKGILTVDKVVANTAISGYSLTGSGDTGIFTGGSDILDFKSAGTSRISLATNFALQSGTALHIDDGTNLLPSIAYRTDPDTGIFLAGTNTVGITSGGTTNATFSPTGITFNTPLTAAAGIVSNSPVLNPDGTALLPAYSFSADTNTGIYRVGNDVLGLSVGGVQQLEIQSGTTIIRNNLLVQGTQTTVNSTTVSIVDNIITLNSNETGVPSLDSGIDIIRGTSTDARIIWNEATDRWEAGLVGNLGIIWTSLTDGPGSGLDADTVDGIEGGSFLRSDTADTAAGLITFAANLSIGDTNTTLSKSSGDSMRVTTPSGVVDIGPQNTGFCHFTTNLTRFYFSKPINAITGFYIYQGGSTPTTYLEQTEGRINNGLIWTSLNDGAGSTLDADLLDGVEGAGYLLKAGGTMTGNLLLASGTAAAPSLGFGVDVNTGIFRIAENRLGVTAGGVTNLEVNNTGGILAGAWTLAAGSTLNATYADLAERYEADKEYEPGSVVIFGGSKELTETNIPYDTRVAGVISTEPAFVLNSDNQSGIWVELALAGRVPVKVIGPVKKGDIIVTSDTPGYGMAARMAPDVGTVIGKSLEDLDKVMGTIEVAV